jgi:hypothetical protein
MALIIVAGDKGSPGVTTAAVALAAAWPRHAILAECDPHGGDLVYRLAAEHGGPLDPNTGLLSVAIAARRGFDADAIPQHLQRVHGGLDVLVGLGTAEQAGAVTGQWSRLARAFDQFATLPEGGDVIADCGRVGPSSPALELMPQAALVLLIARADAEQVAHVRDRANGLAQRLHGNQGAAASIARPPIGVVLIAKHREAKRVAHQVGDLLSATAGGAEVLGVLAEDPEGAAALSGRVHARVDKSLLMRSARDLANSVTARYALLRQEPPAPAPTRAPSPAAQAPRAAAFASDSTPPPTPTQSYQYPSASSPAASTAPPPTAAETTAPMMPIRDAYTPPVAPIYSAPQPHSADQQSYQYSQRSQYAQQPQSTPQSASQPAQPPHASRYPQHAQQYSQQAQQPQQAQQAQNTQYPQGATHYYQAQYQAPAAASASGQTAAAAPAASSEPASASPPTPLQPQSQTQPQPQLRQPFQQPSRQPQPASASAATWPVQDAVPTSDSAPAAATDPKDAAETSAPAGSPATPDPGASGRADAAAPVSIPSGTVQR